MLVVALEALPFTLLEAIDDVLEDVDEQLELLGDRFVAAAVVRPPLALLAIIFAFGFSSFTFVFSSSFFFGSFFFSFIGLCFSV